MMVVVGRGERCMPCMGVMEMLSDEDGHVRRKGEVGSLMVLVLVRHDSRLT